MVDLSEIFIVSDASVTKSTDPFPPSENAFDWMSMVAGRSDNAKCGRCWRLLPEVVEDGDLCNRCESVVHA
jgi:isoleucyl-tRNA synthetase